MRKKNFAIVLALASLISPGALPAYAQKASTSQTAGRELAEMYKADQEDRATGRAAGEELMERDTRRRARVQEIIRKGGLASAGDYYHAAMILQHSNPNAEDYTPELYLLAHALAVTSALKGNEEAKWLSAATLDRFLTFTKQKQFFGTQYQRDENQLWQPGDYSDLLTDKLRKEFGLDAEEMQKRADRFNRPKP